MTKPAIRELIYQLFVKPLETELRATKEAKDLEHENFLAVHRDNMALNLRVADLVKELRAAREALRDGKYLYKDRGADREDCEVFTEAIARIGKILEPKPK